MPESRARVLKPTVQFDRRAVDAILAPFDRLDLPGVAVGVTINGEPAYRGAFGAANIELSVPLATSMRMRIGSTSKHFTALAWLLLCEEGRAELDQSIRFYLPELHSCADGVTVRDLLANVSGLRDAYDIVYQFSGTGRPVPTSAMLELYRSIDDVNAPPGAAWIYNNGGFMLAAAAIERIENRPFEEVLHERIFLPSGMSSTLLRRWDTDFVSNSATLHMVDGKGGFTKSYLGTASAGQGGIVSTVDDMLRWLAHMDAPVVGTKATWETIRRPQRLRDGTSTGYGLALMHGSYRGVATLHHGGGVMGGNCQMLKAPALDLDIVVITNRHDVSSVNLAYQILDVSIAGLAPVRRGSGRAAEGAFVSRTSGRVIQMIDRDGVQSAAVDGFELPLALDADGFLRPVEAFSYYKFAFAPDFEAVPRPRLRFDDFGASDLLEAAKPAHAENASALCGRYRSIATDTDLLISREEAGLTLQSEGRFGDMRYMLEPLGRDLWRAHSTTIMPLGGIFALEGETLLFSSGLTRRLPFRRQA